MPAAELAGPVGRWCTAPLEPDTCKTCFDMVLGEIGTRSIVHLPATGFYQEARDQFGHEWRQGVCDRPDCRSRVYAAEQGAVVVEFASHANSEV